MKIEKLKELLYDIHRKTDYDDIHNLLIKYLEDAKDKQLKRIIVKSLKIDYTDRLFPPVVQLNFILPPEFLKHDSWTIENILKETSPQCQKTVIQCQKTVIQPSVLLV